MLFRQATVAKLGRHVCLFCLSMLLVACSNMGMGCDPAPQHGPAIMTQPALHCSSHLLRVVVDVKDYRLTCAVHGPAGAKGYQATGVALPQHNPSLHFTWCAGMLVQGAATCQATYTIIVPFAPTTLLVTARFTPGQQAIQATIPVNG